MVTIRKGKMRDCTDLLTVYQTTRWYYREKTGGYQTVQEIKDEHKGGCFKRWGWLVAEEQGTVIGEIVFRLEKNPVFGRIGIIRNMDIDVRHQKKSVGTLLTRAAEGILKKKKVKRITLTTPPEAYNFWMKIDYFARGSLLDMKTTPSKIKKLSTRGFKFKRVKGVKKLPSALNFSHVSVPGQLCENAHEIFFEGKTGRVLDFRIDDKSVGVGVVVKDTTKSGRISVDVMPKGIDEFPSILSKLLMTGKAMKLKSIRATIPKDQLALFKKSARWSTEEAREIPITRII